MNSATNLLLMSAIKDLKMNAASDQKCWDIVMETGDVLFQAGPNAMNELAACLQDENVNLAALAIMYLGELHHLGNNTLPFVNEIIKSLEKNPNTPVEPAGILTLTIILGKEGLQNFFPDHERIYAIASGNENQRKLIMLTVMSIAKG